MCVALPGKVIEIKGRDAVVDFNGNQVTARAGLVDVKEGDYVLVHAGCVIQKVTPQEAEDLTELMHDVKAFE
jgi:hydrogenase expression/formation protein HypC